MDPNRVTFAILAMFAGCAATSTLAQSYPFDGLYKPRGADYENWDCQIVGQDRGAISIKGDELRGIESQCRLLKPTSVNGMDAVLYDMECAGEGEKWTERVMFMKAEFGVYYIINNFVAEWQSCAAE